MDHLEDGDFQNEKHQIFRFYVNFRGTFEDDDLRPNGS